MVRRSNRVGFMRLVRECLKCGHEEDFRSGPLSSCPDCGGSYFRNAAKCETRNKKKDEKDVENNNPREAGP
jgi:predicted  nucleic acid-binding Zn-ribbon protein